MADYLNSDRKTTNFDEDHLDRLFYALSDRTRRQMLLQLTQKELSVSELGKPFEMTKQSISKHISVLQKAGLINKTQEGRIQRCQFNPEVFAMIQKTIGQFEKFWQRHFDALEDYIEDLNASKKKGEEK